MQKTQETVKKENNLDLRWLEDFVTLAEKRHFARAAEVRNVTQSAFSRRIKALEGWAGAELLDRTRHPVALTPAGVDFLPYAKDIIGLSYQARSEAAQFGRVATTGVTFACLHTLSLFQIPSLISDLRRQTGPFEASIVAETRTVEEYLTSLFNGSSDFFVCYRHEAFPLDIDATQFPRVDIGSDRILPFAVRDLPDCDLSSEKGPPIPYLEYSGTSFLSRVVHNMLAFVPSHARLRTVYRGTLAENLCAAAINSLGLAWLPETVVASNPRSEVLKCVSEMWGTRVDISVYKAAANNRTIVNRIWGRLGERVSVE